MISDEFAAKELTITLDGKTYKLVNIVEKDNVHTYEYLLKDTPTIPIDP